MARWIISFETAESLSSPVTVCPGPFEDEETAEFFALQLGPLLSMISFEIWPSRGMKRKSGRFN